MLATLGLAFLAGALSTLSPCVLPLLPLVIGAAAAAHRLGPLALGAGLASFSGAGSDRRRRRHHRGPRPL
jgi:thiol:disulfide interchange protein